MTTRWTVRPTDFSKLTREQHKRITIACALDFQRRVTMKTPVGDPSKWKRPAPIGYVGGHARANWLVSVGESVDWTISLTDKDGRPSVALAQKMLKPENVPDFPVIWIQNNLPYIKRLNEGWSEQAPAEFVNMALLEAAQAYGFGAGK